MSARLLRHAAARLTQSSSDLQLLVDGKDLPGIAVRIRKPELVLPSKATGDVVLDSLKYPFTLQTSLPFRDLLDRLDFTSQVNVGVFQSKLA
jgi:hypothetical protein